MTAMFGLPIPDWPLPTHWARPPFLRHWLGPGMEPESSAQAEAIE
jgi:hypothetical protein